MIKIFPHNQLGKENSGWLDTHYHFSFANYFNPERMGMGNLKVINDDTIQPGKGFDMHPHKDMEIITYVTQGAVTHKDSKGNHARTEAGNIQIMSAGKGIYHSEFNTESIETKLFQIWIKPREKNLEPTWQTYTFTGNTEPNKLNLVVSGDGSAPLTINQDAKIYIAAIEEKQTISHDLIKNGYLIVSEGQITLNGKHMDRGDGAEITDNRQIEIKAILASKLLLIEI